jgi:hypothetical protein
MQILHAHRQTVQRPCKIAFRGCFIRGEGLRHQLIFRNERNDRVNLWIHSLDLFQMRLHHFACGKLLLANELRHFPRRQEAEVRVRSGGGSEIRWSPHQGILRLQGIGRRRG